MKVKEIMSSNVRTVKADRLLSEIAELFTQPNTGGMPVVDNNGNMIGLVTMTDFIGHFLPDSPLLIQEIISSNHEGVEKDILSVGWEETKIEDIMEKRIITVGEEDSIVKAAALCYEQKIRLLPVVNSSGKLVGVVTLSDICKGIYESIRRK